MIIFKRKGGVARENSILEVANDGSFNFQKFFSGKLFFESRGTIDAPKFDRLLKLILRIDFDLLEEDYSPKKAVFDGFQYYLTVVKDEKKKIMTTKTEGMTPPNIQDIINLLESIILEITSRKVEYK